MVPPAAAVLAVGHDLEPQRLLAGDRLAYAAVFDRAQLPGAHFSALDPRARFLDLGRAQEAADLVRPERRLHPGFTASVPQLTINRSERCRKLSTSESMRSG